MGPLYKQQTQIFCSLKAICEEWKSCDFLQARDSLSELLVFYQTVIFLGAF